MYRGRLRTHLSLPILSVIALLISILSPVSQAAAPSLVTCINLQSGTERISHTGKCRYTQEAQANWHKNPSDSPIASGASAKVITICSNKESSPVTYQVIRSKCAKHQLTTIFSRSGALPNKPVIAEAVSFSYDSASLKLATDPATNTDAPIAFYTITSSKGAIQRIYSWRDLTLAVTGLQAQTTYSFTVSATSADGSSQVSAFSNLVTTAAYVPPSSTSSSNSASVAAPAFTLSSTAETKTVNNAISGYTISSTGGTIASYAISPAAPAGLTFNTTTGLLAGTPTATQSATTYTITATNASGSASNTFTLTVQTALSAPVISLTSNSETRVATTALVGYTIDASAGGAVASYALTGTLPAGLTFSTSTGLITGSPTETKTATTYTITATNAAGSSSATYRLRVTGDLGDTGPGGGKIFYYSAAGFNCGPSYTDTGSPTGGKCKYLEVAPSGWNGGSDPTKAWAVSATNVAISGVSSLAHPHINLLIEGGIGVGYKDSLGIFNYSESTTASAVGVARAYRGGSLSDWYLGSPVELSLLCQWARGVPSNITSGCTTSGTLNSPTYGANDAGFTGTGYWGSTQANGYNSYAYNVPFQGSNDATNKVVSSLRTFLASVRPIRAF